jgi:Flp pilus assembly protein TadG
MIRRAWKDESGAALVEFALVAPLMFLLFFGGLEIIQAVEAQKRVAHIAAAVADVVAQTREVDDGDLRDVASAAAAMMAPFPSDELGQRIASFTAGEDGIARLDWSFVGAAYSGSETLDLPDGFLAPGESVVVSDTSYLYEPALTLAVPAAIRFQKRAYLRPRLSEQVLRVENPS